MKQEAGWTCARRRRRWGCTTRRSMPGRATARCRPASACLREDRWLVHHLASDLPTAEVARLADQVSASLVVLSSATAEGARRAQQETWFLTADRPDLNVLAGRPGDSLRDLLAQAGRPPAAGQEPRA